MAENPEAPPRQFVDPKTGMLTETAFRWLEGQETGTTTQLGALLSGQAQNRADIVAAQATADGAAQQAADVGAAALPFSASASPANVLGTRFGSGAVTTNSTTVTPAGGTGPFTFAWAYVSGDVFTVNGPTSASTSFSTTLVTGEGKYGVYACTVTDSLLATATANVGVSASELS